MSGKDHHRDTFGPGFWLAAGVGSAMLASQLMIRAMRAMHEAGAPARMMMKGPFGAGAWMFGRAAETPAPEMAAPEASVAPKAGPRAGAEVAEAEVVAVAPETAPVIPTPEEAAAEITKATEPFVEAARAALDQMSAAFEAVTPAAPEGETKAEPAADLAEALEPESAPEPAAEATPADAARPTALAAPKGAPDDLRRIKGIGPKLAELLNGLGYYHFDQIAAWGPEEIAVVDESLGTFAGRALRDDWIGQAKALAAGETVSDETN